jgi:aminoglycoside/choline kinase family phosphotransferase
LDKAKTLEHIHSLFEAWAGQLPDSTEILPVSGSDRRYFRLKTKEKTAIAAYNKNREENEAFIYFSKHFRTLGIAVPAIYCSDLDEDVYLIEDLGDQALLAYLLEERAATGSDFPEEIEAYYQEALRKLAFLQIRGTENLDYSKCYPTSIFNQQSMLWDCNQFKYWYLQPTQTQFNEMALEADFQKLTAYLMQAEQAFFMFRDFQARNIMIHQEELFFIDYQGGRKGPLQYDVVSLLFQAKAAIPHEKRLQLLDFYLNEVESLIEIDREQFKNYYYGFVLLRTMQVLGAYGFKGYYQRKAHFLTSIPFALRNLAWWMKEIDFPLEIPHLRLVFGRILEQAETQPVLEQPQLPKERLRLHMSSFSYKAGLPEDKSGHGAGFVFDCRCIHNPGRYEEYKKLSGLDQPVKTFFWKDGEMERFLPPIFETLGQAVKKYLDRGFSDLGINFGCTGGQHRSVYAVEAAAKFLKQEFGEDFLDIRIEHRERFMW